MQQWEYRTIQVRGGGGYQEAPLDERLNEMASEGWELAWIVPAHYRFPEHRERGGVSVMTGGMEPTYAVTNLWVFRRPVPSE